MISDNEKLLNQIANLQKQVEQMKRADSNPKYTAVADGRLSLSATLPVTTADQDSKQTLYYLPYLGNKVLVLDDADNAGNNHAWRVGRIPDAGISFDLSTLDASAVYDVGVYWDTGLVLDVLKWTNTTTRASELTRIDGKLTFQNGGATRIYLGTIYLDASKYCFDSVTKRYVWNFYNQVVKRMNHTSGTAVVYYVTGQPTFVTGVASTMDFNTSLGFDNITASTSIWASFLC